jgi:hypothetical protein
MGPNLLWHIGGGEDGIHHFMETLMDPMFALMKDLGNPQMTTELKQTIIQGVIEEAGNHGFIYLILDEALKQKERKNKEKINKMLGVLCFFCIYCYC